MMNSAETGVLLVDWENLAGAVLGRGKMVERTHVDDLWAFANRRCGGQLHHAHMAAAKFDGTISAAMREHLISAEMVRSTKEQADILLTVLAMDYLHTGVKMFILVTGDQDFIPLIQRLHRDGRTVTVVYGDPSRLSVELRQILTTPGLDSVDIADVTTLRERKTEAGCRSLLGLLELQRRGVILGGKERGDRTALLADWGVLENQDENQYWSLIETTTEKAVRVDAAVMIQGQWTAKNTARTYLHLTPARLADVVAIDYAVRRISSRPAGLSIGGLRTGPFQTDSGAMLDRVVDALCAVQLVRKGADGTYSLLGPDMQLGYLEQLSRVFAGLSAECYRRQVASIPYGQLAPLLGRRGIGQGVDQRAAGRISNAIKYAQAAGVVDVVAVDGKRHAIPVSSSLSRQFEQPYHELYRGFSARLDESIGEAELTDFMERQDVARSVPLFGFDRRDRHRMLRILAQSQLAGWRDGMVTLFRSGWGDAAAAPGR
jgi:hypothetical protein